MSTRDPHPLVADARRPLTAPEVARMLGVSPQHVRRLVEAHRLGGLNIGSRTRRHWRVNPDDLTAFIEARLSRVQDGPQ